MKVKYTGRSDAVVVAGQVVERDVAVDLPDEVATGLLEGDWSKVTTPKPAKGDDAEEAN